VKLNSTGDLQWQNCLGGSSSDLAYSVKQCTDGGYIVTGEASSNNGDVSGNHGSSDIWIVKLNGTGDLQWQNCLGGSIEDYGHCIQQTTDGGYIVAGAAISNDGDVSGNHGYADYWIVKLNETGQIQWQKCFGGTDFDVPNSIQQTSDGGYIVAGCTWSNDGDVSGNHGARDVWIVKLNGTGSLQWQKCLGGSLEEFALDIMQTTEGGYIVAGWTTSNDGDVIGNHGLEDYWVLKLTDIGDLQWQKCFGGSFEDYANSIQQTADGGYIVAGWTISNDGDVSGNHGGQDFWVLKLEGSCQMPDVPVVNATPGTICEGESVTLTITSGNLNGATAWHWYTGSCGGTPVGTGISIIVNPSVTTTYFVRGEGGCAGNGGCASKVVTVNPYPDPTIHQEAPNTCYYTNRSYRPEAPVIPGATYQWNFGSTAVPTTATGYGPHNVYYTSAGTKEIRLVIYPNDPGAQCPDSSILSFDIITCPGQVIGRVQSTAGNPIAAVNVRLYVDANTDGIADSTGSIRSVNTTSTGMYGMSGLTPGHFIIVQTQPSGWISHDDGDSSDDGDVVSNVDSLDNIIPTSLIPNEVDSMNVYVESPLPGAITGYVFHDFDNDEVPETGEGLENVEVKLFVDQNTNGVADDPTPIATVMSNAAGLYQFSNVQTGNYVVVESQPIDYISIKDFDQSNDGDEVPNTNMTNDTIPVTITNAETDANNYFIEAPTCGLTVTNLNDSGPGTFRSALDCAQNGDTICFHPSLSGLSILINSAMLEINKEIVIFSLLTPRVTIASQITGLFDIQQDANVEFTGVNFVSGVPLSTSGAAFINEGMLKLQDVMILRNPIFASGEYLIQNQNNGEILFSGNCFLDKD
jgi:Ig-like domain CHU_C associated/SdrD B-like domain